MRARNGELSGSIAVLALVVEESDSAAGVNRRFGARYPHAQFARNLVTETLPRLERQGFVERVAGDLQRAADRYEATPRGVRRVERWLRESSATLPVLRDDLRAKLCHVRDDSDLDVVVGAIKAQERALTAEFAEAHLRLKAAERSSRNPRNEPDLTAVVDLALLRDEATLWGTLLQRRQRLREYLEGWKASSGGLDG